MKLYGKPKQTSTVQAEEQYGYQKVSSRSVDFDVSHLFFAVGAITIIIALVSGGYSLYSLSLLPSQYLNATYIASAQLSAVTSIILWLGVGITEITVGYMQKKET
jgi:uncharacterized membrane protein